MSWTVVADASTTWVLKASAANYVDEDYVVDLYIDDSAFSTISDAANTWSAA